MNQTHRAIAVTDIQMGPILNLEGFRFELGSEIGAFTVSGYVNDTTMVLRTSTNGGKPERSTVPFRAGMLLDAVIPIRVAAAGLLKVGQTMQTHVFNPSTMSEQAIEVRVTGRDTLIVPDGVRRNEATKKWLPGTLDTIPVWLLEQKYGSIQVTSWVGRRSPGESPESGWLHDRTHRLRAG